MEVEVWWVDIYDHTARAAGPALERRDFELECVPKHRYDKVKKQLDACIDIMHKGGLSLDGGGPNETTRDGKSDSTTGRAIGLENLALRGWP